MGAVVAFDYQKWINRYPEFAQVTGPQAEGYFDEAQLYHNNTGCGFVSNPASQLTLLNMVTAHIADRYAVKNGQEASPLVGQITNATEGSVSVQTQMDYPPGTAQWWKQTKYGADYWTATQAYRTMRYLPARSGPGGFPWSRFR